MHIENVSDFEPANGERLYVAPEGTISNEVLMKNAGTSPDEEPQRLTLAGGGKIRAVEVDSQVWKTLAKARGNYSLRFFTRTGEGDLEEVEFSEPDHSRETADDLAIHEVRERLGKKRM
jgi:hypothetical protein